MRDGADDPEGVPRARPARRPHDHARPAQAAQRHDEEVHREVPQAPAQDPGSALLEEPRADAPGPSVGRSAASAGSAADGAVDSGAAAAGVAVVVDVLVVVHVEFDVEVEIARGEQELLVSYGESDV